MVIDLIKKYLDNNTFIGRYFQGEPGLSFFIEVDDKRILFDTGYSEVFIENARKLDIDLRYLDYLVFCIRYYAGNLPPFDSLAYHDIMITS